MKTRNTETKAKTIFCVQLPNGNRVYPVAGKNGEPISKESAAFIKAWGELPATRPEGAEDFFGRSNDWKQPDLNFPEVGKTKRKGRT